MRIVVGYPPIIDRIVAKFPKAKNSNVLFSWGDIIYSPNGNNLTVPIRIHEEAHGARQSGNPESWWDRYLAEDEFRLVEEIIGHKAEYAAYAKTTKDRNQLASYANFVALRLASPLYGSIITVKEARKEIVSGL